MKNLSQFLNFSAVARHRSFAQAARELGLAPSSVAKSVARLEKDLGARLFHRTTRALTLTEEGRTLFAKCESLAAQIDALDLMSLGESDEPSGMLRIGAPIGYGVRIVLPLLARLRELHPALEFDLRLSDGRVAVLDEGFDAVVRIGQLEDSTLIAHKIDEQQLVLCASPAYLSMHHPIRSIHDLAHHTVIVFRLPTHGRDRPLEFIEKGRPVTLTPNTSFRISHGEALAEAAVLGIGIAQMPQFLAQQHLAEGALVELLPRCRPTPLAVNLVLPGSRVRAARVRALVDALTDAHRARPGRG
ncbi:DNA-binding transcriptional regulator, LysR family [Paraburkholderia fungorum]|uniref:DNA-binding transcriptional regulator, LysR family n=1 Tax=Paraburkholderia fungorum TaxID=134537 RepID=A0A1H1H675_9BURK|nr:LysR family transcriptional regulator [Paraburkholderia fungorum]SDR20904.1 DNA-binding transcriptional regulator, LysR family [Paraburkholderia fungorum]